ncbi:hypothetical protein H8891_06070 [Paeniclostridium sp. NSJ-45]|uniref:AbiTii domain-containing protein n=1 Tax=Paeniclostridium hominis TaxID=2764329 RepID=A0ABR7K2P9_9FIRM|nr:MULTISPECIES: hypothetical protein [Paeniclostridium]MBC6003360.1 hypothetical protein [Paeniclostridium hominis]
MSSLVLELQQKCLDSNISVSDLLRHALVLSKKLYIKDAENWIYAELNGYKDINIELPKYRVLKGECLALNIYSGVYIPVVLSNDNEVEFLTKLKCKNSLPELEYLVKENNSLQHLTLSYPETFENHLRNSTGYDFKYVLSVGKSKVKNISDNVKNRILEWSLDLECSGILGENMTFTSKEREIATSKNYTYNYFYGNISDSQIQQNSDNCEQSI